MTHTIKDILREGIEELKEEAVVMLPMDMEELIEQEKDSLPFIYLDDAQDWLKAHDQKLLQAVIDTARGMKKDSSEETRDRIEKDGYGYLYERLVGYNIALADLIASITPIE